MTVTIPRHIVESAMERANIDLESIRTDYSGRGMYGSTCFGLDLDYHRQAAMFSFHIALAAELATEEGEFHVANNVESMISHQAMDSLGMGIIVYFPGFKIGE